jgi:hypothetical protein
MKTSLDQRSRIQPSLVKSRSTYNDRSHFQKRQQKSDSDMLKMIRVLKIRKAVGTKAGAIDNRSGAGELAMVGSTGLGLPSPSNGHSSIENHGTRRDRGQPNKLRLHSKPPSTVVLLFANPRSETMRRNQGKPSDTSDTYGVASLIKIDKGTTLFASLRFRNLLKSISSNL